MQLGRIERALSDFEQVLRIDPDNVNAALTKASCLNLKVTIECSVSFILYLTLLRETMWKLLTNMKMH